MTFFRQAILFALSLSFLGAFSSSYVFSQSADEVPNYRDLYVQGKNFREIQTIMNGYWATKNTDSVRGWKSWKRWEYFWQNRVLPNGDFPQSDYLFTEWQKKNSELIATSKQKKKENGLLARSQWKLLGPSTKIPTGGGAGRLNICRFDPEDPDIIWVGSPAGGLWKTTNFGESWVTTTDSFPALGISDIAINPKNRNIMYLATGDDDGSHTNSYGVLKSVDGGKVWTQTGLSWQVSQSRQIGRILIHPERTNIVITATTTGIFRSTNEGKDWVSVQNGNFRDMEFKPGSPDIMYASSGVQIFRSSDAGLTWTRMSQGVPSSGNRIALGVTPADPEMIYALVSASNNGFGGLFRSTDGGDTWTRRSSTPNILGWSSAGNDQGGQGWYDLAIAVSESNPNVIFCGGVNIWRSNDGGSSWSLNAQWQGQGAPYVHADIHDLVIVPGTDGVVAGTDGGFFFSSDGTQWRDLSNGLQILQLYKISVDPDNTSMILGGSQDNGTNRFDGTNWAQVGGADGMDNWFEPNSNFAYSSIYYGSLSLSTNNGQSFRGVTRPASGPWVTPYCFNPRKPQNIYGVYSNGVYASYNRGSSWSRLSGSLISGTGTSIAIAPSDTNFFYCLLDNNFFRSTDGGATWSSAESGLPGSGYTGIAIHPTNPQTVYLTTSGYNAGQKIYMTTNAGGTWTNITRTGLPNVPVSCVAFFTDPCGDRIFLGTDIGVYYGSDNSSTWTDYNEGLPNVIIRDLEINGKMLRAGTFGRGVWEIQIDNGSPVAKFDVTKRSICEGETVQFFDKSSGVQTTVAWQFSGGEPTSSNQRSPFIKYMNRGTYKVQLNVKTNCGADSLIDVAFVAVNPPPASPEIEVVVDRLRSVNEYATYQWVRNSSIIPGATNREYLVRDPIQQYSLRVTDVNGCQSQSTPKVFPVSVEDDEVLAMQLKTQVYPNPTNGNVSVSLESDTRSSLEVRVINVSGDVVYSVNDTFIGRYEKVISLQTQPSGSYLISFTVNGKRFIRKVVKE
jgi:PKD repeat protein